MVMIILERLYLFYEKQMYIGYLSLVQIIKASNEKTTYDKVPSARSSAYGFKSSVTWSGLKPPENK